MKKLSALLLALVIALGAVPAFADAVDDLFAIMETDMLSGTVALSFKTQLEKPLKFLAKLNPEVMDMFDYQSLAESAFNADAKMNVQYDMSKDYKKIKLYLNQEYTLPLAIHETFKNTTWMRLEMWLDMDLTDTENPVMKITYKTPFSKKYLYYDASEMMKQQDYSALFDMMDKENVKEINQKMKDSMRKNADISFEKGVYTVKIDDKGARGFVKDMTAIVCDYINASMPEGIYNPYESLTEDLESFLEGVSDIKLLGDKGITFEYIPDNSGYFSAINCVIDVDTNIYDIIEAFDGYVEGYTRADWDLSFEANYNYSYSDVNKAIEIPFPKLTPDNIVDLNEKEELEKQKYDYYYDDYDYDYIREYDYFYVYDGNAPVIRDGKFYVPLRPLMGEYMIRYENIIWDNGRIEVIADDSFSRFEKIEMTINENEIIKDGEAYYLESPVIEAYDKAYVSDEFVRKVLDSDIVFHAGFYDGEFYTGFDINRYSAEYLASVGSNS